MAKATIPYLKGFEVKPFMITQNGNVIFTDGTAVMRPNQMQCEAYGYTYDITTGTCSAFPYSANLNKNIDNSGNTIKGSRNVTQQGTHNTQIYGESNTVKGLSRNNIIAGNNNEISNGVNNTYVYGTLAQSTADNSIVLGGNAPGDLLAERQTINVMFGVQTTDNSTVPSYLNNVTGSLFPIPENTAMYFCAEVLVLRVGGVASGSPGDFASWLERGVIINESGTTSISRNRKSIVSVGSHTNWRPTAAVDGNNFVMNVRGATDHTLEWVSNIRFTQIKTNVSL
jgi:hypothetical protein